MNAYTYDQIFVGMEHSFSIQITEEMMDRFCEMTGDTNPLHRDVAFARMKGFPERVVYGMLVASFFSTLAGVYLPGRDSLILSVRTEFHNPVFLNDRLTITGTVSRKDDHFQTFSVKVRIRNEGGQEVCRGRMEIGGGGNEKVAVDRCVLNNRTGVDSVRTNNI